MDQLTFHPIPVEPLEASYAWSDPEDALKGQAVAAFIVGPEDWYPYVQHGDVLTAHIALAGRCEEPRSGEMVITRERDGSLTAAHWPAGAQGRSLVAVVTSVTRPVAAVEDGTPAGCNGHCADDRRALAAQMGERDE